jgi:hypothetical protein
MLECQLSNSSEIRVYAGFWETKDKPKQYIKKNKTCLPKRSRNSTYTNTNWMEKRRNSPVVKFQLIIS